MIKFKLCRDAVYLLRLVCMTYKKQMSFLESVNKNIQEKITFNYTYIVNYINNN